MLEVELIKAIDVAVLVMLSRGRAVWDPVRSAVGSAVMVVLGVCAGVAVPVGVELTVDPGVCWGVPTAVAVDAAVMLGVLEVVVLGVLVI